MTDKTIGNMPPPNDSGDMPPPPKPDPFGPPPKTSNRKRKSKTQKKAERAEKERKEAEESGNSTDTTMKSWTSASASEDTDMERHQPPRKTHRGHSAPHEVTDVKRRDNAASLGLEVSTAGHTTYNKTDCWIGLKETPTARSLALPVDEGW